MAFYNEKMMKNANLMKAWRAAHNIKSEEDDANLPEVCEEIENHVRRNRHPCSRLSLRTASELINGASRLYLDQVDLLLRDALKLAYGPISDSSGIDLSQRSLNSDAQELAYGPIPDPPAIDLSQRSLNSDAQELAYGLIPDSPGIDLSQRNLNSVPKFPEIAYPPFVSAPSSRGATGAGSFITESTVGEFILPSSTLSTDW